MAGPRHIILAAACCAAICAAEGERRVRIVGGVPAPIEQAPWLVQLLYLDGNKAEKVSLVNTCAGSIVGERLVLTAAHCFAEGTKWRFSPTKFMKVLVGSTEKVKGGRGKAYAIQSVAGHPKFNDTNQKYDLAVIKLTEPIKFSNSVKAIPIAKHRVPPYTDVMGGGWGVIMNDAPQSPAAFHATLKTAALRALPDQFCRRYLARTDMHPDAVNGLLCMQPVTGMPCFGDSGSGLWLPAQRGQPAQLLGVLEGGVTCALEQGVPFYVDILNSDVKSFLVEHGVLYYERELELEPFI